MPFSVISNTPPSCTRLESKVIVTVSGPYDDVSSKLSLAIKLPSISDVNQH